MGFLTWGFVALLAALLAGTAGFTGLARDAATGAKWAFGLFTIIAFLLFGFALMTMLFINGPGGRSLP